MSNTVFDERFWLDAGDKSAIMGLASALEARAHSGQAMQKSQLQHANLANLNLVKTGSREGYDFSDSDLYRANLQGAHLFAINLRGASLMKADLRFANLHCADLRDCNLLGVQLEGSRLDNIVWDKQLIQERRGYDLLRKGETHKAQQSFQEAEETYRNLRLHLEKAGLFEEAGQFFLREMVMRRKQMPRFSGRRLISRLVDLFSGYGENPLRVVLFSIGLIGLCGLLFFLIGLHHAGEIFGLNLQHSIGQNLTHLGNCIYFSVVTFTTLGYGDISPVGWSRPLAAFEAFSGSFTMALFVVVFVKKMTR